MSDKLHRVGKGPRGGELLVFHCPGCCLTGHGYAHPFEINVPNGTGWTWNGSMNQPTFSPSLLCNASYPELRCHSFVREGMIQFLDDCHHELRGKTVELPDWE